MRETTRRKLTSFSLISAPFIWTVVFLFVPYMVMFTYSFYLKKFPTFVPAFEFVNYMTIVSDPQYYQVLMRTARIAFMVASSALLIAYPLAYFLVFKIRSDRLR
jgi:spermidine/putrescine transport system permease protein